MKQTRVHHVLRIAFAFALVLVSAGVTSGSIIAVVTNSLDEGGTALVTIDPSDGSQRAFHGFPNTLDAVLPDCFAALPGGLGVMCVTQSAKECLVFFNIQKGAVTGAYCSTELVIDNVGFDAQLNRLFFGGFNMTQQRNYVYEISYLEPEQGPRVLVSVPGIVQVAINAYSSSRHLFFLTLQMGAGGQNLVVVDVVGQRIAYNVTVEQGLETLAYDDVSQTLFMWAATEVWAAALYKLNYTTGNVLGEPIYTSETLSSNEAAVLYDPTAETMYAQLMDFQNSNWPSWVAVNIKTRNFTVTVVPESRSFPWILNMAIALH